MIPSSESRPDRTNPSTWYQVSYIRRPLIPRIVAPQPEFDSAQQMYYTGLEMLYRASSQPQPRSQSHDPADASAGIERIADGLEVVVDPPHGLRAIDANRLDVDAELVRARSRNLGLDELENLRSSGLCEFDRA